MCICICDKGKESDATVVCFEVSFYLQKHTKSIHKSYILIMSCCIVTIFALYKTLDFFLFTLNQLDLCVAIVS